MFAGWKPSMVGEPWDDWQDAHLTEDWLWGCGVWIMAKRARRTEEEVIERLAFLGLSMEDQPKGRKIRRTDW